jgi:hypothetical protein
LFRQAFFLLGLSATELFSATIGLLRASLRYGRTRSHSRFRACVSERVFPCASRSHQTEKAVSANSKQGRFSASSLAHIGLLLQCGLSARTLRVCVSSQIHLYSSVNPLHSSVIKNRSINANEFFA